MSKELQPIYTIEGQAQRAARRAKATKPSETPVFDAYPVQYESLPPELDDYSPYAEDVGRSGYKPWVHGESV